MFSAESTPITTSNLERAYVALGSNLGDRRAALRHAIAQLPGVFAVSGVYETEPVGGEDAQGPYLNMVVGLDVALDPYTLLQRCLAIETEFGRVRTVRNAARTLDVDLLLFESMNIRSEHLTIPHPRMWSRRFVLVPLSDIAPHMLPADWEERVSTGTVTRVEDL